MNKCLVCNNQVKRDYNIFCSRGCKVKWQWETGNLKGNKGKLRVPREIVYCLGCNKEIITSININRKYCSNSCQLKNNHPFKNMSIESRKRGWKKLIGHKSTLKDKNWEEICGIKKAKERKEKASILMSKTMTNREPWNIGLTKETDERVAQMARKSSISHVGQKNLSQTGWGKAGFRKDLNCFFRSKMEANFARILNYLGIEWEYEPERIFLKTCSYLPDFYLPQFYLFIEVKGGYPSDNLRLRELNELYPNFPIKILDGEAYNLLLKRYCIAKKCVRSKE